MEELHDYEEPSIPVLGALNIARHIRNRRRGWRPDLLSFRPLYDDRPGFNEVDLSIDPPPVHIITNISKQ